MCEVNLIYLIVGGVAVCQVVEVSRWGGNVSGGGGE